MFKRAARLRALLPSVTHPPLLSHTRCSRCFSSWMQKQSPALRTIQKPEQMAAETPEDPDEPLFIEVDEYSSQTKLHNPQHSIEEKEVTIQEMNEDNQADPTAASSSSSSSSSSSPSAPSSITPRVLLGKNPHFLSNQELDKARAQSGYKRTVALFLVSITVLGLGFGLLIGLFRTARAKPEIRLVQDPNESDAISDESDKTRNTTKNVKNSDNEMKSQISLKRNRQNLTDYPPHVYEVFHRLVKTFPMITQRARYQQIILPPFNADASRGDITFIRLHRSDNLRKYAFRVCDENFRYHFTVFVDDILDEPYTEEERNNLELENKKKIVEQRVYGCDAGKEGVDHFEIIDRDERMKTHYLWAPPV